jgi:hypothetical protein
VGLEDRAAAPLPNQPQAPAGDAAARLHDGTPQAQALAMQERAAAAQEATLALARGRFAAENAEKNVVEQQLNPDLTSPALTMRIDLAGAMGDGDVDQTPNPAGGLVSYAALKPYLVKQEGAASLHGWRSVVTQRLIVGAMRLSLSHSGSDSATWSYVAPFDVDDPPPSKVKLILSP